MESPFRDENDIGLETTTDDELPDNVGKNGPGKHYPANGKSLKEKIDLCSTKQVIERKSAWNSHN